MRCTECGCGEKRCKAANKAQRKYCPDCNHVKRDMNGFPQSNQDPFCEVHYYLMGDGRCSCLPKGKVFSPQSDREVQ
jgi:hypothetical protein